MNGLEGNHSPVVRLRARPLKHTQRKKYVVEDSGQGRRKNMRSRNNVDGEKVKKECVQIKISPVGSSHREDFTVGGGWGALRYTLM